MNGKYLTWFNELSTADQLEELAEIVGDITDDEGEMLDMVAWLNARMLIAIMQTGNVKVKVERCYT